MDLGGWLLQATLPTRVYDKAGTNIGLLGALGESMESLVDVRRLELRLRKPRILRRWHLEVVND
jgi:hypothetical protein